MILSSHQGLGSTSAQQDFKAVEKQSLAVSPPCKSSLHQHISGLTKSEGLDVFSFQSSIFSH